MCFGQGLLETRLQLDLGGLVTQDNRGQCAEHDHQCPVVEYESLQEGSGLMVEFTEIGNYRQIWC